MAIRLLTTEQHQELLRRLLNLARKSHGVQTHPVGLEYTSLMVCFLLHSSAAAESLLRLATSFGNEWFPATIGYLIDRSLFEVTINARYIARDPQRRARQYIDYERITRKKQLDAFEKHGQTTDPIWQEFVGVALERELRPQAAEINQKYQAVISRFERVGGKQKKKSCFSNWSGKTIREMALEVDHEVEYDVFYSMLSSFTHADVSLANRFLRVDPAGPFWSQRANDFDVANVFRFAAIFNSCFLGLFGSEFKTWTEEDIRCCWQSV